MYSPQLDTFLVVAQAGSFNKAAEELFVSTPAVIKQINHLEEKLGVKLFIRSHRGLILTASGRSLYEDAKQIVQLCNESVERVKDAAQENDSLLRIGTSTMTPGKFILDYWPQIHPLCPNMKVQLIPFENNPTNAREILRNLGHGIDVVAGAWDEEFLESRKCAGLELFRTPIQCAMPCCHRLAGKEYLDIEDLYGEDFMMIQEGWNRNMDELRNDIKQFHPQIHIVDFDLFRLEVFNQCENNNCLLGTLEPWVGVHPLMKVLPVSWDYKVPYGLLHSPEPSRVVQQFLDAFQMVCASNQEKS